MNARQHWLAQCAKNHAESVLHCEDYEYGFKRSALALVWAQCAKNHAETAGERRWFWFGAMCKNVLEKQTVHVLEKNKTENKQSCHCVSHDELLIIT